MQIGSHVRAKRIALGLSQEDLATELGVKHQHVSRIELGDGVASPSSMRETCWWVTLSSLARSIWLSPRALRFART